MTALTTLPVTFPASKKKTLMLLAISTAFVGMGVALYGKDHLTGGACVVFFGLGMVVSVVNLHPRASYLTLTDAGFEFSSLFRKHFVRWSDVLDFIPYKISHNEMVGFNYSPHYRRQSVMRRASAMITDIEAGLPDTYGHEAVDLARLMNDLRRRYAPGAPVSADGT